MQRIFFWWPIIKGTLFFVWWASGGESRKRATARGRPATGKLTKEFQQLSRARHGEICWWLCFDVTVTVYAYQKWSTVDSAATAPSCNEGETETAVVRSKHGAAAPRVFFPLFNVQLASADPLASVEIWTIGSSFLFFFYYPCDTHNKLRRSWDFWSCYVCPSFSNLRVGGGWNFFLFSILAGDVLPPSRYICLFLFKEMLYVRLISFFLNSNLFVQAEDKLNLSSIFVGWVFTVKRRAQQP